VSAPRAPRDDELLEFQAAVAGRYAVERELGRGGMGIVYLARDLRLERVVAIKVLPPERARDASSRERFVREARTAAKLSHPHIIPIHAVEEAGAFVFFVMTYVDGETLGARLQRDGALKPHEAARILREVAWALAYAHGQGVIHRDVKPDNILLERGTGRALVADFGIARLVSAPGVSGESELVGTPEYMSPEQVQGEADGRSDLYALGVVGYYAVTGRLPFSGSSVVALLAQHATQAPPPLEAPECPAAVVIAIERCLAKAPADRFATGEELAGALGTALEVRRELPVPIRAFLSERRGRYVGPFIGAAILVPMGLNALLEGAFAGSPPALFRGGVVGIAAVLCLIGLVSPAALAWRSARRLLRTRYRHDDLVRGLELEVARRREEQDFATASEVGEEREGGSWWARTMRAKMYAALALAGASGAAAFVVPYPAVLVAFGVFGLSCATAVATGLAALAAARGRRGDAEERRLRFWQGRLGRWLFKVAGWRLGRPAGPSPAADRPTEAALSIAARDLFDALPAESRRQLGDLPTIVASLEADIGKLRKNGGDQRQLQAALGALENIRLDLLRLHAGVGTVQGLTADLGAARRLGEQVDALLDGPRESAASPNPQG
jgi:serine/threonine-protein kinase